MDSSRFKFRAWDIKTNELLFDAIEYTMRCLEEPNTNKKWEHIITPYSNNDRFVLEQYTGLKDCNGIEIYEGDIVKLESLSGPHIECEVKWSQKLGQWRLDPLPKYKPPYIDYAWDLDRPCKKIGNIHENQEFLEGK